MPPSSSTTGSRASYRELAVRWQAEAAPDPRLLVLNERLAADLGLDADWLRSPEGVRFLVGALVPSGATPVAQAYAGHQFGGFVPRLGDGRALLLGDHTSFYRLLGRAARGDVEPARGLFVDIAAFDGWMARWQALAPDADAMDRVNPVYVPRNHLVEEALTAATAGDLDPLSRLLAAVTAPHDERPSLERYAEPAPEDFGAYRTFCGT